MPEPPQTIGPYRVLRQLGAGGMGEVFLAYDDRLDRNVAIKRIRPEAGTSPERRERFRREARISARLNHPAIVRIYDILTDGDLEHIVMEHVEGTDLNALAERGPLAVRQVLDLARQLADGLDAAHRLGIVHRDFKAENVLVTPEGQVKIADFGIAKQLLAKTEESLTRENAVLGTYRTMSPEQARGEPVDHRTDLFAFGVLLYEALTGRSPFEAENALATLHRVIHHRQTPVREINPAVPARLSALVDHLLEKDPALRPRSAGQVRRELEGTETAPTDPDEEATVVEPVSPMIPTGSAPAVRRARPGLIVPLLLALVLAGGAAGYLALRRSRPPLSVGVLRPTVEAGSAGGELDLLASGVRVALLQRLVSLEGISPRAFDEMDVLSGPPAQIARAVSADELVAARLDCRPESCRVSVSRLRGKDGSIAWADSIDVPTDDFALVASAVSRLLRRGYAGFETRRGVPEPAVSSQDLKRFLELRRRFDAQQDADLPAVLAELAGFHSRAPRFLDAYLLEADVARRQYSHSRDPGDLARLLESIGQARTLAPEDPRPLFALVEASLEAGKLDQAETALNELGEIVPADARLQEKRAYLLRARGEPQQAIALMRSVVQRQPSWKRLYNLAILESGAGQIAAARGHLEAALARAPGNPTVLSKLATLEMVSGDLQNAVRLFEQLVQRAPGPAALSNLGLSYLLAGRYADAVPIYLRLTENEPRNPEFVLNLADTDLLAGHRDAAMPLYRKVIELVDQDPRGGSWQLLTVKAQALAHLGQAPDAVAAIQQALRLAPDEAQVAYEASVVYALVNEPASATVFAERALKQGFDRRWFQFPWFLAQPAFRDLLKQPVIPGAGR
jgi:serine/threonine-protein kinase